MLMLASDGNGKFARKCYMSSDLFQNARQTMGELRDIMRELGISWRFIQYQIDLAMKPISPIEKAFQSIDDYTTGFGKSLKDLPSNVW